MGFRREVQRLQEDVGELLEAHERAESRQDHTAFADRPVAFFRETLGAEPWDRQRQIAEKLLEHPLVTVRSCHAAGKDWLAARLALWWCYARKGLVILTGPSQAQVEEILMRGEIRTAFRGSGLPGELHVKALRPAGEGKAGILAKTARGVSALTGFHDARVLFIITEAQDPEIEHAWDAAFAVATGAEDRILTLGNPTVTGGRFFRAHQTDSDWHVVKVAASDVPNVREERTVVPGLLTREGMQRFAAEYGGHSGVYTSRVLAEFPDRSEEGLFARSWLEGAADRHEADPMERAGEEPIVAVDPARFGADATVAAVRRGDRLERLVSWGQRDTMGTVEKLRRELSELGVQPENRDALKYLRRSDASDQKRERYRSEGRVVVDTIGLGAGVADRLEEMGYDVEGFKGSRSPKDGDRFENLRAEGYWMLRDRLEAGEVALPRDEDLFTELLAIRWHPTAAGKIRLEKKDEIRARIGRSPDRADAVAMAFWPKATGVPGRPTVVHR